MQKDAVRRVLFFAGGSASVSRLRAGFGGFRKSVRRRTEIAGKVRARELRHIIQYA